MVKRSLYIFLCLLQGFILIISSGSISHGQVADEVIAGSSIPVPPEMHPSAEQGIELMVPGFLGGQAVFQGKVKPTEVIRFYQKRMPQMGWEPYASLVTGGGLLVFTQPNKSVLIMVSESKGNTTLAILVGAMPSGA